MANMSNDAQNLRINTHRANGVHGAENGLNPSQSTSKDPSNSLLQTSTNIFIYANGGVIGMVQSFRVSESRGVNKLQSVGYEGVVQAVPNNTQGGQLDVTRIALYNSNLWRALGLTTKGDPYQPLASKVHKDGLSTKENDMTYTNGTTSGTTSTGLAFRTLRDQRVPFEVQIKTPMTTSSDKATEVTFYEEKYVDCWLSSYNKSYAVNTITVAETATIQYADVY